MQDNIIINPSYIHLDSLCTIYTIHKNKLHSEKFINYIDI